MVDVHELERICEAGLKAVGYDLVDLEYLRDQQGWVLRVYIDHPAEAGADAPARSSITHEDCAMASRQLGTVLDVEDPIDVAYRLEVSSPGVHRPLRKQRDFERYIGRRVRVAMRELLEGRRNFVGRLAGVDDGKVTVEVDGQDCVLPLDGIRKARLDDEVQL